MAYITPAERVVFDKGWHIGWKLGCDSGWHIGWREAVIVIEKLIQNIDVEIISQEMDVHQEGVEEIKKLLATPALPLA